MMKRTAFPAIACFVTLAFSVACTETSTDATTQAPPASEQPPHVEESTILQSWQGEYPVARLDLLPEEQRQQAVGFIGDAETFEAVWQAFRPGEDVPEIDFETALVVFARNTQFYNRISIGKVNVTNGVAEVLAMETMSAMPIEDELAMSLAVIERRGITAIQAGDQNVPVHGEQ